MSGQKDLQHLVKRVMKGDDFIKWLFFANAGMLNIGNIWCLDYAISHLPSQAVIVEIGSFCGLSTNLITYLKLKHGVDNKLVCCDPWDFGDSDKGGALAGHPYIQREDYKEFVKSSFIKNVSFFSQNDLPFAIESDSDNFFVQWSCEKNVQDVFGRNIQLGGAISLAYIDGNHTYEFAKRDFANVDNFLEVGGFILFDDSADGSGWEVCQVVAEVSNTGRYQLIKKAPNYFFQKVQ